MPRARSTIASMFLSKSWTLVSARERIYSHKRSARGKIVISMGRHRWSTRNTVEDCLPLSSVDLRRAGLFRAGPGSHCTLGWPEDRSCKSTAVFAATSGRVYLQLENQFHGNIQSQSIELVITRCRFGGRRFWFLCPLIWNDRPCAGKVLKLYCPPGEVFFGCRRCYYLTYTSAQTHDKRISALAANLEEMVAALGSHNSREALRGVAAQALLIRRMKGKAPFAL